MRPVVHDLNPEQFPFGLNEVWLHLVDDALGVPIRCPVLVLRGEREGPVLGLTAAVHGDEVNGTAVIHHLLRSVDPTKLRGTILAVPVVNVPAYHRHARTLDGADLNHFFPGSETGTGAEIYATRLMNRCIRHCTVLLDLHTASRGRANCLYIRADMGLPETARMAYLQRPQVILHDPAKDKTLRGAASRLGIPAITVEVGNSSRFQKEYIRKSVVGLRAVLSDRRMVPKRPMVLGPEPAICASSEWLYTDQGGLLTVIPRITDEVTKGEEIAVLVDAFGVQIRSYTAPFSGVVIGRAVDPVAPTGSRILHLGRLAAADSPFVRRDDA